jgi:hypothetical protein
MKLHDYFGENFEFVLVATDYDHPRSHSITDDDDDYGTIRAIGETTLAALKDNDGHIGVYDAIVSNGADGLGDGEDTVYIYETSNGVTIYRPDWWQ